MAEDLHQYPHRMYKHWNEGDMKAFYEMLHPNVVDHGGDSQGREGVAKILDHVRSAFPDFVYTVDQVLVDGDMLCVRLTATGTQKGDFFGYPATNKKVTWTETRVCRVVDGLTTDHWANIDSMGMLSRLGHIPPPGKSNW
jgi:predicted ester cyclase